MTVTTRLRTMMVVIVVAYSIIAGKLFYLTVIKGAEYKQRAESRRMKSEILPARRATILDRYGRVLAVDEPSFDLFVRISELEGEGALRRVARLLHVGRKQLREAVSGLETEIARMSSGLESAGVASVHAQSYRVPAINITVDDEALLELAIAPEDYWGFEVLTEPDGGHALYVCPAELRGDAAMRRVEEITDGEITVTQIRAAIGRKLAWIEREATSRLGARASNAKRRAKVTGDLRGWSLPIVRDVGDVIARDAALHPEHFAGFELLAKAARRYPAGNAAVHLIGLVNQFDYLPESRQERLQRIEEYHDGEFVGVLGVEGAFETRLHGQAGYQVVERTRRGGGKRTLKLVPPIDGETLQLTLDIDLQIATEAALDRLARPAAAVALDPNTGEILAMASSPRYDPTDYFKKYVDLKNELPTVLVNRTIRGYNQMPPGSVFKLVTALAGLEEGTLDAGTTVYNCRSSFRPGCTNHTSSPGPIGLRRAMAKSCNVFFASAALDCGSALDEWTWKLGFGQPTGIEIGEHTFRRQIERARSGGRRQRGLRKQMGIGQIVEASPLQIARMTAAFANGGRLVDCHLDLSAPHNRGKNIGASPQNLETVRRGLEDVVDFGTASGKGLDVFRAAGKTGSAQAGKDRDSPQTDTHAWFTCYAPRTSAEIVVTVFIDHIGHGGDYAAPVARDILDAWTTLKEERGQ